MTTPKHHQLIILGSGPAGCTAAIYASRASIETAIITGIERGGQLTKTPNIENWPGESEGISGSKLMDKMIKQTERFNTKIISDHISQANLSQRPFYLKGDNDEYTCDALIIATGASAKYLDIPSEQKYIGRGVSACPLCDGFFYKNKRIAVIGGGNTAAEDALYLAKLASEVLVIHRRDNLRAEPVLLARLKTAPNIKFEFNYVVDEILGNDIVVSGLKIKDVSSNLIKEIKVDGVFIAIGNTPNTKIFTNQIEMDQEYIKVGYQAASATSIAGIFAAGDVVHNNQRQAVVASGSGCIAALDAKKFLALAK